MTFVRRPDIMKMLAYAMMLGLVCLIALPTNGQTCFAGGLTLMTQAEVDAFGANHPNCRHIEGALKIGYNESSDIVSLSALTQIRSIGGDLIIIDISNIQDLHGLDGLTTIGGSLRISSNDALQNLKGLEQIRWIGGSVRFSANRALEELEAMGSITKVNGDLSISECNELENLAGLDSIRSVGGHLIIEANEQLISLQGLHALKHIEIDLLIQNNGQLRALDGLAQLDDLGQSLLIDNNRSLLNIRGLANLRALGKNLQITNNESLLSIQGLSALREMNGLMQFFNNPQLIDLDGLDSLDHNGIRDLAILSSSMLSACQERSICDYLKVSTNTWSIRTNDEGCNSRDEILKHCPGDGGSSKPLRYGKSVFFPNPTSGALYVRGDTQVGDRYQAINMTGQKVMQGLVEQNLIDLSNMPSGCYFVAYISAEEVKIEAVIKVQ